MKPVDFGDYKLIKKLATGGMGEVYLARQEQGAGFERYVAIKRILPELSGDDEFVRMFLDEARLAARLSHPNVVQIYDLGICGDQYYIAMEFLEGRDLRRIMGRLGKKDRALPGAHAVQIIHGAAEGLFYAHELKDAYGNPLNIIHRDVSPQNIFVSFHGTIKVLDFGIAKAEARSVRTRTGGLKGKYPYLSPEQVRGEDIDSRSDVFSLGTVLWEITVGRRLFKRDNDLLTLQAVLQCEVPLPSELMNNYPPELETIVMKSLASDPDKRYSTCRILQEDLEGFVGQYGLVLSPQKLGKFSKNIFSHEPQSVTDIIESLKQKPTSKSLLLDGEEGSESFSSRSFIPPVGRDELTEPSGSAIDQSLLDRLAASGRSSADEASGSNSSVSGKPQRRSPTPPASSEQPSTAASLGFVEMFEELGGMNLSTGTDLASSSDSAVQEPALAPIWTPVSLDIPGESVPDESDLDNIPELDVEPDFEPELDETQELTKQFDEGEKNQGEDISQAIARAPTAVLGMAAASSSSAIDVTDLVHDEESQSKALADTTVRALPEARVHPDANAALSSTPSEGTALPPLQPPPPVVGGDHVYSDQIEVHSEPLGEMDEATIALSRPADLVSLVRQWPRATLAAIIAAVVFPFILVISIVALIGNGATSDGSVQGAADAGESETSPDASSLSSLSPPLPPLPPTIDSSIAPPVGDDGGAPFEEGGVPTIEDSGLEMIPPPLTDFPRSDGGVPFLPPITEPDTGSSGPSKRIAMARLSVITSPGKLRVFVDNRPFGTSPVTVTLRPGSHRVTVRGSSIDHSVQVRLGPGERRSERITVPNGELALVIRPYADVFIDGRHVGLTPRPPVKLSPGRHRVRLVNNSLNRSILRTVTIRSGRRTTISLDMADTP